MGYTTDFEGHFTLNKKLTSADHDFLIALNETRRMKRNIEGYGIEGEFYVDDRSDILFGQAPDIVERNKPPKTQPGLWCQWRPTDDGLGIEWDGGEKAYAMSEWLVYLLNRFLIPRGYLLNGIVSAQGEERRDVWELQVAGTIVTRRKRNGNWEPVEFKEAPLLGEAPPPAIQKTKFEIS